jgi:hypothetical protein
MGVFEIANRCGNENLGIWEFGNLGIWEFGNLGIWEFGNLGMRNEE